MRRRFCPKFCSGDSLPAPSCPCGVRRSKMFIPFLRRCPADVEEAASKGALPARSCRSVSGHFRALRPGPYPDFTLDNRLYQGFAKAQEGPLIWPLLPGQNPTLATPPCRPIYERLLLKFGLPEASEASSSIESAIKRVQQIERSGRPRSQHRHGEPSRRSCRLGAVVLGIVQGNRIWNSAATLAGFCVSGEMDSTGSRMIRGAGECFGSLYRMLERFGRPSHWQCGAA